MLQRQLPVYGGAIEASQAELGSANQVDDRGANERARVGVVKRSECSITESQTLLGVVDGKAVRNVLDRFAQKLREPSLLVFGITVFCNITYEGEVTVDAFAVG